MVLIEECRPLSADKRWKVAKKLAAGREEEAAKAPGAEEEA